ncbi:PD-(D/E)XK nuclease family protein [Robiginitalea aurantiaca]|uniref:PD-(D/E)XK nuclease family protein n=1 Tax=Robiginitalea aurantiaca TaxID=3056915 RepID=A0ABT7WE73_9FLAO|nr:PD-(D/E)XK nuclease family protein [Robiginitalea aurantiaca]MDM9631215.1 PD-(D/E)XK nuclease family protein [Robiginitalea aurantiaca]
MISFLESVLEDFGAWHSKPEDYVFILPSKRAGYFLKNLMATKTHKTLLAPKILSIETFIAEISELQYATSTKLMFNLYEAYRDEKGLEEESFYDFSRWGGMLLQDFNEIDRYLVDEIQFFDYLGSLQEIRHWTPDGSSTPMIDKQVRFWKSLLPIYQRFRNRLEKEGLGYQGQVYRKAASRVAEYQKLNPSLHYIFAGFNALNKAEEFIIRELLENDRADIFWDADEYYLENTLHDAGYFLRKHFNSWKSLKNVAPKGVGMHFSTEKNIQIAGLPKSVAQAKYAGGLIGDLLKEDSRKLENTALILGDESLLNPVLHSLPEALDGVNITMGYPLKDSSLAHLFKVLFQLYKGNPKRGVQAKTLLELLTHPFLQEWFTEMGFNSTVASGRIIRDNIIYLNSKDLQYYGFPQQIETLVSLYPPPGPGQLIARFTDLLEDLKRVYMNSQDTVSLEFLRHFHLLFNQLSDLNRTYPFISDNRSLLMLFEQLLAEDTLDFEGKPLEGLQIMGMLESRCLDFETVVITSVNEGVLPAGKTNSSFIPFEVKREFGLPTFKEKDAVYTYHFYRLLQRAKNIYICYNTEPDVLEGGEPSRFIHQLRNDPRMSGFIQHNLAAPESGIAPTLLKAIDKSSSLLEYLGRKASTGFSPTSLSRYIEDPLEFYRKTILGIHDTLLLEETIAANTFGNVIHETLELLYLPLLGQILTPEHLRQMKNQVPEVLSGAFEKHYLKGSKAGGKNLIALSVMGKYIELFLEIELKRIKLHEVRILGIEKKLTRLLNNVPGCDFPVRIKGTVDRVETVDGALHIIDYKTGRVEPTNLRITDWQSLREDPKKSKAFQVMCYAWLMQQEIEEPDSNFRAGVFSFKNIRSEFQWFGIKTAPNKQDEVINRKVLLHFEETLKSLIAELFNATIPIEPIERI